MTNEEARKLFRAIDAISELNEENFVTEEPSAADGDTISRQVAIDWGDGE